MSSVASPDRPGPVDERVVWPRWLGPALTVGVVGWALVGGWLLSANDVPDPVVGVNPWSAHGIVFFGFTITLAALLARSRPAAKLAAVAGVVLAAVATESFQLVALSNRTGSIGDVIADLLGAALGVAVLVGLIWVLPRSSAPFRLVAVGSLVALVALVGFIVAAQPAVAQRWWCRSGAVGPDPAAGQPVARYQPEVQPLVVDDARAVLCRVAESDELTLVAVINSDNVDQDGPTRIVTSSIGDQSNEVNVHLGQTGPHLSVRVRNGDDLGFTSLVVTDVVDPGRDQTVAVRVVSGLVTVWVDGEPVGEETIGGGPDLGHWRRTYPLVIGDEATGGRRFEGRVSSVELYATALADDVLARP